MSNQIPKTSTYDKLEETNYIVRHHLLKIKLKSLAEEAKIIRREENKCNKFHNVRRSIMTHHRKTVVRKAARDTHIAYGLIKGYSYLQIEKKSECMPDWKSIEKMLNSYVVDYRFRNHGALTSIIEQAKADFAIQYDKNYRKVPELSAVS